MPLPRGEEADRCRRETSKRLRAFCAAIDRLLPDGDVGVLAPEGLELAAVVEVRLVHQKGHRRLDYHTGKQATLSRLTLDEKARIAQAVGQAAYETGLEALHKPSVSTEGQLFYKVFWKEEGSP